MKVVRFNRGRAVSFTDAKLELGVQRVEQSEGYAARPSSVGEIVWRPLFGFFPARRRKVIAVRFGDATPLEPLRGHESYIGEPVTEEDLNNVETQAFGLAEMNAERHGRSMKPFLDKAVGWSLILLVVAAVAVIAAKFGPQAIENWKGG